jgi:hypothetical protein
MEEKPLKRIELQMTIYGNTMQEIHDGIKVVKKMVSQGYGGSIEDDYHFTLRRVKQV